MNTRPRKKAKNDFDKDFFKLMNNWVFGKTIENVRDHRDIKLAINDKWRNYLASEPDYPNNKTLFKKSAGKGNEQNKCQNSQASIIFKLFLDVMKK